MRAWMTPLPLAPSRERREDLHALAADTRPIIKHNRGNEKLKNQEMTRGMRISSGLSPEW